MNVFYEEDGHFKVGAIFADNNTSLQVEAPHGKRAKIKAQSVLLRFESSPTASTWIFSGRRAARTNSDSRIWGGITSAAR